MDERSSGTWRDLRPLVRREVETYLAAVPALAQDLPTRCPPWTVADVTRHLAATFERYARMLAQARRGDLTPPFGPGDLAAENLRAVRDFGPGDPYARLRAAATAFLDAAGDPGEPIAHQRGPIPVGEQVAHGLRDVAVHHDDVAAAAGTSYTPPADVVDALVASYRRLGRWDESRPATWASFVEGRGS